MNSKLTQQRFNTVIYTATRAGINPILSLSPAQVAALYGGLQLVMSHPRVAEMMTDLPQLQKVFADLRDMMIGMGFVEEEIR